MTWATTKGTSNRTIKGTPPPVTHSSRVPAECGTLSAGHLYDPCER
jgi:hypothetical protein